MPGLVTDLRRAARNLRHSPGFALTAITAAALGIASTTAVFSVVNKVLLEPLPYPDPDRLVQLQSVSQLGDQAVVSIPKFIVWRDHTASFLYMAAYDLGGPGLNFIQGDRAETLPTAHVSRDYFRLLGGSMEFGRDFSANEDSPKGGRVVVIGHSLWKRRFGGDSTLVGREIVLDGESYRVAGILAPGFYTERPIDIWLPLQANASTNDYVSRVRVVARLRSGVTLERAQRDVDATINIFHFLYRWAPILGLEHFAAIPLRKAVVGDVRPALFLLIGAVAFVLLISCANVANLLLARGTRRAREIAIRAALGAQRGRLIRELLSESLLLSLGAGVAGLALGFLGVRELLAVSPVDVPRIGANGSAITLDWRVFCFTLLLSILTGILFGLLPALTASRADVGSLVKENAAQSNMGLRRNRGRAVLVIGEMTLALILLVGAGLLIRTFVAMRTVNRGFDEHNVVTAEMSLTGGQYDETARLNEFVRATTRRLRRIPGVVSAATTCVLPLEPAPIMPFTIHKNDQWLGVYDGAAEWRSVSPEYFDAFRIRLMRGRFFTDADDQNSPPVVLINRMMFKKYWNAIDANPIGEFITIGKGMGRGFEEQPRQIIGVVADVRDSGLGREPMMYVPAGQVMDRMTERNNQVLPLTWVMRTAGPSPKAISAMQQELKEMSGGLPLQRVRDMHEVVAASSARTQFYTTLLAVFAGLALILAGFGLYGLMAYSVQQRTQEIGIRMALGAAPADLRRMVIWQGMRLAWLGIVIGAPSALALARVMDSLVFGITTWDPTVFIAVAGLLSAVGFLAMSVPSSRATRVDPASALRS